MPDPLLPHTPLEGPPQLTNCDREPIHIPGSIQPHGCLMAIDRGSLRISHVSENALEFLGSSADQLLDRPITRQFPWLSDALTALAVRQEGDKYHRVCPELPGERLVATLHHCDQQCLVEWENDPIGVGGSQTDLIRNLFATMSGIGLQAAYDLIVNEIQQYTGFDRVMLYQFLEDGHGTVVAEARDPSAESFLGLHYPASDIPKPARRLYELNWIRMLADLNAEPVPILAAADGRPPLNMTYANLRSISPIHIEYLQNMKIGASMSISVMEGERLWGLIACHHQSSKHVPLAVRSCCELSGSVLSTYLTSRRQQDFLRRQVDISSAISQQMTIINNTDDLESGLERSAPSLCQLLGADGMIWHTSAGRIQWGVVPEAPEWASIQQALEDRPSEPLSFTDQIGAWRRLPLGKPQRCAGLLVVRLGRRAAGTLAFFRQPYRSTVMWAGNPDKSVTDESGRLTPRKSFAAWRQSVEGKSRPWTDNDLETANSLRSHLQTVIVEQNARLQRVNQELQRLNTDLDAFAFAASHDLRDPLRGLQRYVTKLEQSVSRPEGKPLPAQLQATINGTRRLIERMQDLLEGLLRFSRAGSSQLCYESFLLSDAVEQARDLLFAGVEPPEVEIRIPEDGQILGDFACVREILGNLISNGIKYNDRVPKTITLGVRPISNSPLSSRRSTTQVAIYVSDNGIGIPPQHLSNVFRIFTRLHGQDKYGGGSGAGLTIVRRLVERHGGRIIAESGNDGTTFHFCLSDTE